MLPFLGGRRSELLSQSLQSKTRIRRSFCPFKCVLLASRWKHSLEGLYAGGLPSHSSIGVDDGEKSNALELLLLM